MNYVKRTLMLNCHAKWMIQNKKLQHNRFSEFISKVILPCATDLGESSKRILEKRRKRIISIYSNQSSTILSSGKDIVPANKRRGVVNGVQRSGDARGHCLIVYPSINSNIEQWRLVVIATGHMLFVTCHCN